MLVQNMDKFVYSKEFLERIRDLKPEEQEIIKDFWRSVVMRTQPAFAEENGRLHGSSVRSCNCCPYGYHIDLDFVRYCESLASAKPSEEQLRRRSRRRSRKSMEFMLGLESLFDQWDAAERVQMVPEAPHEIEPESPNHHNLQDMGNSYDDANNNNNTIKSKKLPPPTPTRSSSVPRFTYGGLTSRSSLSSPLRSATSCSLRRAEGCVDLPHPLRPSPNSPPETRAFLHDALDEVCNDFERTLERTSMKRKKVGNAVGGSGGDSAGIARNGGSDRNNNFMTSCVAVKKRACHTWEEYVDALDLACRLSASPSPASLSPKYASPIQFTPQRISPIALESVGARMRTNSTSSERQLKATLKRDVAIMCVLHATRDIAVGTPLTASRTIGTDPLQALKLSEAIYTHSELDEHVEKALKRQQASQLKQLVSVGTQMFVPKRDLRDAGIQTAAERTVQKYSLGVSVKPQTRESFATCKPETRSVGCSEHRLTDVLCQQCAVSKRSVACGTESPPQQAEAAVSLKLLDMPGRSKTFSLGDTETLSLAKRKTVGTQYVPLAVQSVSMQTTPALARHSVGVQIEPQLENSATQCSAEVATRETDTGGLLRLRVSQTVKEEVAPAAVPPKAATRHRACNTDVRQTAEHGVNTAQPAPLRNTACNTQQVATRDFGCGDVVKPHISIACADNYCDSCKDAIKHLAKDFSKLLPPASPLSVRAADSRIPRPKHLTSPSPVRKNYQRQTTYTITPSPTPSPVAEKRNILSSSSSSSLHEKSGVTSRRANSPAELTTQRKADAASPLCRRKSAASNRAAELETVFTKKPVNTYEPSHAGLVGHDEDLIVKEETCVRISWSRAASPAAGTSVQKKDDSTLIPSAQSSSSEKMTSSSSSSSVAANSTSRATKSPAPEDEDEDEDMLKCGASRKLSTAKSSQSDVTSTTESTVVEAAMRQSGERVEPSAEMCAALTTVNDSLRKPNKGDSRSINLKAAKASIREEWFRVASTELSRASDVACYLSAFRGFSVPLLEFCVNLADNNGNTVMHYAVSHGNFEIVSTLLDSKVCNVNQTNNAGYTCVMLVSLAKLKEAAHRAVVQRLFLMADVNIRAKKHGQTALMLAVSHGNLEMVEMLLSAGADINMQDEDGSTALMCAAEHERIDIVKRLLLHPECDSLIQDVDGSTAFKIAWQAGHRDIGLVLYMHEQMLRNKLSQKSGESSSSRPASLSPRNHKRQPSQ